MFSLLNKSFQIRIPYWATGIHPLHGALRMADLPVASPPVPRELRLLCEQRFPITTLQPLPRALIRVLRLPRKQLAPD